MRTKLKTGEQIALVSKKHWIVYIVPLSLLALVIFLGDTSRIDGSGYPKALIEQLRPLAIAITVLHLIIVFIDRQTDIWIVTNLRVIDEWGILTHNASECRLDKIHNVSYRQSIIGRILGFGDVIMQTAAEKGVTVYKKVAQPKLLQSTIFEMQNQFKHRVPPEEQSGTRKCPYCAETIKEEAIICRFCNRELRVSSNEAGTDTPEPPRENQRVFPQDNWGPKV